MKEIDKTAQLKKLEKELEDLKKYHRDIWSTYGSELCAGDMFRQEDKLEEQIKKLKTELNDKDRDISFFY